MDLALGPWGETIDEMVDAGRAAEGAGMHSVWAAELHRSATIPLAALSVGTPTIGVGTGIALAFVRSPMALALTALDLDELSGGRLFLGVGSGVARLNEDWHNATFGSPVVHLRETIHIVREVVARARLGEPVEFEGEYERIRLRHYERPFAQPRDRIPVYVAAMGPRMTQLAGEVGDGWIAHELGSPAFLRERVLPRLDEGISASGRSRPDVTVVASLVCTVHRDSHEAKRRMAGLVAFYASVRTYTEFFAWHGFEAEALAIQERFRAGDVPGMLDACPDEMIDAFACAGTPDEVRAKLRMYDELADVVKLTPPTHYVDPEITRESQATILELVAG